MPSGLRIGHTRGGVWLARAKRHLHHGVDGRLHHWGASGHHASRARQWVHPRHDRCHVVLLLFHSVLFNQFSMFFLLFPDLGKKNN